VRGAAGNRRPYRDTDSWLLTAFAMPVTGSRLIAGWLADRHHLLHPHDSGVVSSGGWLGAGTSAIRRLTPVSSRQVPGKTPGAGDRFTLPRHAASNGIAKADRGAAEGAGPWDLPAGLCRAHTSRSRSGHQRGGGAVRKAAGCAGGIWSGARRDSHRRSRRLWGDANGRIAQRINGSLLFPLMIHVGSG
jgi:hypothetical protein